MAGFNLQVDVGDSASYVESRVFFQTDYPLNLIQIKNAITGLLAGTYANGTATANVGAIASTAVVTIGAGDFANNDTITINGVVFTAKTSGATGNQFNIGASLTETAANLVAAILASTSALLKQTVLPTSDGAVVTLVSRIVGVIGNTTATGGIFTLAKSAANVTITSTFAGGTDGEVYNFLV